MTKIGLFDSGVGGLTVLKELLSALPDADYLYFGDTARVPYGSKSADTIKQYAFENSAFMMNQAIDLLVIPCNTVCSVALTDLRNSHQKPIIGIIEAACQAAVAASKNKRIAVLATKATVRSCAYEQELHRQDPKATIFSISCPLFVPFVEEQLFDEQLLRPIIKHYLAPLKDKGIDTLVLGCTHYPLLASFIKQELSDQIAIVDPAKACASKVVAFYKNLPKSTQCKINRTIEFCVSDDIEAFKDFGLSFLQLPEMSITHIQTDRILNNTFHKG